MHGMALHCIAVNQFYLQLELKNKKNTKTTKTENEKLISSLPYMQFPSAN